MSLNLTNLFTALGRVGRTRYLIASGQQPQSVPFGELAGFAYVKPAWVAPLAQTYDSGIRQQSASMAPWTQAARTILQQFVAADDPAYGVSLPAALSYLYQQFIAQSATVARCTVAVSSNTPDAANVGTGKVFVTLVRSDGVPLEHTIAETSTLIVTADSYTGNATAGQEPWTWSGAPNVSSLGTGVPVGLSDWDWPTGSGASVSGNCISAAQDANTGGNYLTNGDFEAWTNGTPGTNPPDNWYMDSGSWGTNVVRGSTALDGSYSLQFKGGTGTCGIRTQFNSTTVLSTTATAGTNAALTALASPPYAFNLWLRSAAGTVSAGVLTIDLVNSSGTVLTDYAGASQSQTIALTGLTTTWQAQNFAFRTPRNMPADGIVRLRIRVSTGITGDDVFVDSVTFCQTKNCYLGGPNLCVFSNPAAPFVAGPDPDAFTLVTANDRAGASFCATWQTEILRQFGTPTLLLPSTTSPPTLADTLITGV